MTTLRPPTFVDVLVPVALDHTYSYRVPGELELKPGDIVAVPLGAREAIGVVWADDVTIRPGLHNRMKDVELKLDYPPLKPELRKFVDWVSDYTLSPRGMVLRMCLRMGELGPAREKVGVRLVGPAPKRMTAARGRVLQLLADGMVRAKSEAAHEAGVRPASSTGWSTKARWKRWCCRRSRWRAAPIPTMPCRNSPRRSGGERCASRQRRQGRLFGDAGRRCDRFG